jgi:hypothetical protein
LKLNASHSMVRNLIQVRNLQPFHFWTRKKQDMLRPACPNTENIIPVEPPAVKLSMALPEHSFHAKNLIRTRNLYPFHFCFTIGCDNPEDRQSTWKCSVFECGVTGR